jgi:DNA-binding NarL/FixJ family response regulator
VCARGQPLASRLPPRATARDQRARQTALAANLFGSAEAELDRLGTRIAPSNRAEHERVLAALADSMDPDELAAARAVGRRLSLDEALEQAHGLAREVVEQDLPPQRRRLDGLTAREYEVAVLVAGGLSNRQLADKLVITEKTAKNHVQRVLDKLGVRSRTEIAARAEELGLRDRMPSNSR